MASHSTVLSYLACTSWHQVISEDATATRAARAMRTAILDPDIVVVVVVNEEKLLGLRGGL